MGIKNCFQFGPGAVIENYWFMVFLSKPYNATYILKTIKQYRFLYCVLTLKTRQISILCFLYCVLLFYCALKVMHLNYC